MKSAQFGSIVETDWPTFQRNTPARGKAISQSDAYACLGAFGADRDTRYTSPAHPTCSVRRSSEKSPSRAGAPDGSLRVPRSCASAEFRVLAFNIYTRASSLTSQPIMEQAGSATIRKPRLYGPHNHKKGSLRCALFSEGLGSNGAQPGGVKWRDRQPSDRSLHETRLCSSVETTSGEHKILTADLPFAR